ncbi:hypothetical protein [Bosea caraganae]|uniref:hypothetical protein n=1 Tax=Bosea caraganae TaxID=2763117 RepID=UPI0015F02878|nr:hypothetical protein [Bosea caraganae]
MVYKIINAIVDNIPMQSHLAVVSARRKPRRHMRAACQPAEREGALPAPEETA